MVSDPELKQQIREAAEAEERKSYAERFPSEWKQALAPLGTDANKPHLTDAPALIVVFAQRRPAEVARVPAVSIFRQCRWRAPAHVLKMRFFAR